MRGECTLDAALEAWGNDLRIDAGEIALGQSLGAGCTAQVFKGTWRGKKVAVKRLPTDDKKMTSFFIRELAVMAKTRHPNLVRLLGFCKGGERFDVVLELCHGGTLFQLLHVSDVEVVPVQQLKMARDIAKGMSYLHGLSPPVVHRDLKSLNVLLFEPVTGPQDVPQVKVTDFGLAKVGFPASAARNSVKMLDSRLGPGRRSLILQGSLSLKRGAASSGSLVSFGGLTSVPIERPDRGAFARRRPSLGDIRGAGAGSVGVRHQLSKEALRAAGEEKHRLRHANEGSSTSSSRASSQRERRGPQDAHPERARTLPSERRRDERPVSIDSNGSAAAPAVTEVASMAMSHEGDGTMTCKVGTLQWMSPELMAGNTDYSLKVDVYAYGMLLYEILAFEPPFADMEIEEIEKHVLEGGRPPMIDWDMMPEPLTNLMQACWAQEAQKRPTFQSVVDSLEAIEREGAPWLDTFLGM